MRDIDTGLHYPISLQKLPISWSVAYIEDYSVKIESGFACGKHNSEGKGVIHLRPMNVSRNGIIDLSDFRSIPNDFNEKRLIEGDVLFNNTNSPELIGKTAQVTQKYAGLAFSNHMTRIKFHSVISPAFAALQLHYLWMMKYYLHRCVKHVNQASISTKDMARTIPFILPPLNEQKRIVTKIEELFSELDNGIAALKTAREQLKVYRQAVLKHAFEGKLTAQWREDNKDKLESPEQLLTRIQQERQTRYQQQLEEWKAAVKAWEANGKEGKRPRNPPKLTKLIAVSTSDFEIPFEWAVAELGSIAYESVLGKMLDKQKNIGEERPYLGNINVRWNKFEVNDLKTMKIEESEIERYSLFHGDLVICEGGEPGRCAVWLGNDGEIFIQKALHRVRFTKSYLPTFAFYYLVYSVPLERVVRHFTGTTIKHLTGTGLRKLQFPICSIDEQKEIASLIESKLSVIDSLEKEIDTQLTKAETLRQSILKKAFSGQLVAQDPNDEPASELLARIQAEKAAEKAKQKAAKKPAVKRSRKKKVDSAPLPGTPKLKPVELQAGIIALALHHYKNNPDYLRYFHRTKGEKIVHLAESHLGIDLERDPIKDAAGPVDFDRIRESEDYAKQSAFFKCVKQKTARGNTYYNYQPMRHFDQLVVSTKQQLGEKLADVQHLLTLLAPLSTQKTEVVTTLYAAWNNLLLEGNKQPDDEQIVTQAREQWHENKLRIERTLFFTQLEWMRSKALIPVGKGKKVLQKLGTTGSLF